MRLGLPALLLIGCSEEPDRVRAASADDCSRGGATEVFVLRTVSFPREVDGVTPGFDLDGEVTAPGSTTGCGVGDQIAPDGTEGVDNAFARLRPALDATEASALDDIVQEAIHSGGLLAMIQLDDVDDPYDDACVDMRVTSALGTPMVGHDGLMLASQTFEQDPDAPVSVVEGAELVGGSLRDGPVDVDLPFEFLDANLTFHLRDGQILFERGEDGVHTGVIGGGVAIADLSALAHETGIDDTVEVLLDSMLSFNADLNPDENGVCQDISVSLTFEAVPAFFYEG